MSYTDLHMVKDSNTEQKIKEAAERIFMQKGLSGARMQEIADEAGINKAMLHYYYRSKDKLFQEVFFEVIAEFAPKMIGVLGGELPLKEKVEKYVEEYLNLLREKPYMPIFIFNEMKSHPQQLIERIGIHKAGVMHTLKAQLEEEANAGRIRAISVREFMINLISLCVFPVIASPMFKAVFNMDDDQFQEFINERKKSIPIYVMSAISI